MEEVKPGRKPLEYRNISNANVFTPLGRCAPGKTVRLKVDEAKKYAQLEKV